MSVDTFESLWKENSLLHYRRGVDDTIREWMEYIDK